MNSHITSEQNQCNQVAVCTRELHTRVSATISRSDVIQTRSHVEHQVESITYFANLDLRFQSDAELDTEKCFFSNDFFAHGRLMGAPR